MNILVLCTGNSARSILLESILNSDSKGRFTAYSAGSKPAGRVHPDALALLDRLGYQTQTLSSKSWDVFGASDAPHMDIVITVCGSAAQEECPYWPGAPITTHWGVEDPAAVDDPETRKSAFAEAYKILRSRAEAFFDLDTKDKSPADLKSALDAIGTR